MIEMIYNPNGRITFVYYSGASTNPDLTAVSTGIQSDKKRLVTDYEGSGHRMVIIKTIINTGQKQYEVKYNFRKANWNLFQSIVDSDISKMEEESTLKPN